jgi:ATP phosphoribosyltransferase
MKFFTREKNQIIIGVPSKGRLKKLVHKFLDERGFVIDEDIGRRLQTTMNGDEKYRVVLLHPKDIPVMIEKGKIDVGFTGLDIIYETKTKVRPVIRLDVGKVKVAIAVPKESDVTHPFHLMGKTVGTSFPNIAKEYFDRLKVDVDVQKIQGASEGMPYLGVVDAIVDVVETGGSIKANKLKIIDDEIFDSECVALVGTPEIQENYDFVNKFLRTIY